jgi:cell division cycle 2-like protein
MSKRSRWDSFDETPKPSQSKAKPPNPPPPPQGIGISLQTGQQLNYSNDIATSATSLTQPKQSILKSSTTQTQLPHPLTHPCRSVDAYDRISHIDEGSFGIVWKAKSKETGNLVALKQVKFPPENDGFPMACLREINVLMSLSHPNILRVSEMVVGERSTSVFMVMEYMECDLKDAVSNLTEPMTQGEVKEVLRQLVSAVSYMHAHWFFHRDLKTSNILVHRSGK